MFFNNRVFNFIKPSIYIKDKFKQECDINDIIQLHNHQHEQF